MSIKITIPFPIPSQEKPRIGKYGNWYSPTSKFCEDLQLYVAGQMRLKKYIRLEGDVIISGNVFYSGKKSGDFDHILSTIFDGIKEVALKDDAQIMGIESFYIIQNSGQDCVVLEIREAKNLWKEGL